MKCEMWMVVLGIIEAVEHSERKFHDMISDDWLKLSKVWIWSLALFLSCPCLQHIFSSLLDDA